MTDGTPCLSSISLTSLPRPLSAPLLPIGLASRQLTTTAALDLFPDATVLHLGLFRDKHTLQAIEYYSKLPKSVTADIVYILDPMIATGGTVVAALGMLTEWGLREEQVRVVSVLGSRRGVEHILKEYPGVQVC
jgi:uracil phosphoribosyltransferase